MPAVLDGAEVVGVRMTPSDSRKPAASSRSSPGVRMITANGFPCSRTSSGSSAAADRRRAAVPRRRPTRRHAARAGTPARSRSVRHDCAASARAGGARGRSARRDTRRRARERDAAGASAGTTSGTRPRRYSSIDRSSSCLRRRVEAVSSGARPCGSARSCAARASPESGQRRHEQRLVLGRAAPARRPSRRGPRAGPAPGSAVVECASSAILCAVWKRTSAPRVHRAANRSFRRR